MTYVLIGETHTWGNVVCLAKTQCRKNIVRDLLFFSTHTHWYSHLCESELHSCCGLHSRYYSNALKLDATIAWNLSSSKCWSFSKFVFRQRYRRMIESISRWYRNSWEKAKRDLWSCSVWALFFSVRFSQFIFNLFCWNKKKRKFKYQTQIIFCEMMPLIVEEIFRSKG